ncbi:XkdX family protein [Lentilactobacillus sp. SPB1-3]|uniref:XkdX family protein n=1 Tax=Lentilactobacillus terminaliae TaxID=3003483 RepID=A0ACD5DBV5_9LACO|nr:XkdX family protein [Lentilactobacillus sp. SPB1-3]MCZ0977138.1 XkdX family protein [Lentilactobacillus sp. SPB1-3]
MENTLFTLPNIEVAKVYASWGMDISFMVNWSITPEQYKEITGKDFKPAE